MLNITLFNYNFFQTCPLPWNYRTWLDLDDWIYPVRFLFFCLEEYFCATMLSLFWFDNCFGRETMKIYNPLRCIVSEINLWTLTAFKNLRVSVFYGHHNNFRYRPSIKLVIWLVFICTSFINLKNIQFFIKVHFHKIDF